MRLIDADVLKDNMRFRGAMIDDNHLMYVPWADVSKSIDNAPTVDAVPVVRCEDCKWFYLGDCEWLLRPQINNIEWFCPRGERRQEDE